MATSIGSPTGFPLIFKRELQPNKMLKVSSLQSIALSGSFELVWTIPLIINSSFVKVPVLSKQHTSIFPANGIRKGSMHTILFDCKKNKLLLIVRDNSIGNSAGTTDVIIIIHLSNNLYVKAPSLCNPFFKT